MRAKHSSNFGGSFTSKVCKWYEVCPLKKFYEQGRLEKEWIERYCKGNHESCVRYQMEERGEPHSDNMLPNGEIRNDLK